MKRRILAAAAGAALALASLAACGDSGSDSGSGSGSDKITLGFSQVGAESGWRTANTKSIKDAAEAAGIDLKFSDAQQKQENQIKAIRSFIQQKVDVIAFSPVVETGWDAVLKEAKARRHPGDPHRPRGRLHGPVAVHDLPRLRLRRGGPEGRRVAGQGVQGPDRAR